MKITDAKILIVEDAEGFRGLLKQLVSMLGHIPLEAESGATALQIMEGDIPDLVLLDIQMPGMSGHEVLARMKANARLRHLPVLVISGVQEMDSVVSCIEGGADDYLTKPFDLYHSVSVLLEARILSCLEKKQLRDQEVEYRRQIEAEKRRADELLRALFPAPVVDELKESGRVQPRRHEHVAVLFCDIVNFTLYCDSRSPEEVVMHLQQMVELLEAISADYGLEKLKTLGDAFMATCGLLDGNENPVQQCVRAGLAMAGGVPMLSAGWQVRVGVHVGPVVAGVLGKEKYLYDIWGDTVNTAARVMQIGTPGEVNVSREVWQAADGTLAGEFLREFPAKGKGEMEIFRVESA